MITERGSRAWRELFEALNDAETRKISIDARPDGLAVKVNEFMWTLALDTHAPSAREAGADESE
jgi:hypothetical protein